MSSLKFRAKSFIQKYWLKRGEIDLNLASGTTPYGRVRLDARLMENVNLVGDVRKLPFRSASFNNVLASDILEHFYPSEWENIVREWLRVTRKQLVVEVPNYHSFSALFCLFYASLGFDHKWLESHFLGGPPGEYFGFHKSIITYNSLNKFFYGLRKKENVSYRMQGKFLDLFGSKWLGVITLLLKIDRFFPRYTQKIMVVIKKDQKMHGRINVLPALICPECHGELIIEDRGYSCKNCDLNYPVVKGVPIMLTQGNEHYRRHLDSINRTGELEK